MITAQNFEVRPGGGPEALEQPLARDQLARRLGLDRLPAQPKLVCYWHRDREGRLTAMWEADIGLVPQL